MNGNKFVMNMDTTKEKVRKVRPEARREYGTDVISSQLCTSKKLDVDRCLERQTAEGDNLDDSPFAAEYVSCWWLPSQRTAKWSKYPVETLKRLEFCHEPPHAGVEVNIRKIVKLLTYYLLTTYLLVRTTTYYHVLLPTTTYYYALLHTTTYCHVCTTRYSQQLMSDSHHRASGTSVCCGNTAAGRLKHTCSVPCGVIVINLFVRLHRICFFVISRIFSHVYATRLPVTSCDFITWQWLRNFMWFPCLLQLVLHSRLLLTQNWLALMIHALI